ncbi:MAG: hypothetical protein ACUVT2_09160 [Thiobacillaceae bacterium]
MAILKPAGCHLVQGDYFGSKQPAFELAHAHPPAAQLITPESVSFTCATASVSIDTGS